MKTIWKIYADDNEGVSKPTQHGLQNSTPPPTMLCQQWDDEGPVAVVLSAFTQTHHLQNPTAISCFYNVWRIQSLKGEWSARPSENFNRIGFKIQKQQLNHIYSKDLIPAISAHTSLIIFQAGRFEKYFLVNTVKHKKLPGPKNDSKGSILLMVVCSHPALYSCSSVSTWVLWYLLRVLHPCGFWNQMHIYPWSLSFAGDHSGVGWGGVGWGWGDNVPCACTHLWCYACVSVVLRDGMTTFLAHVHIFDAPALQEKAWDNVSADCFAVVQKWL